MRGSPRRGVWLGLLLAALLIVTVAPVANAGPGSASVPDLRIRRSGGELWGNDIYGSSFNQYVSLEIYAGDKRIVWVSVQNDGPDSGSVRCSNDRDQPSTGNSL
jgi:hypothetical protein